MLWKDFAMVSVKNHHHGCLNPRAQYKKEFTVEEMLASRMISDPITMLQCCPNTDGAAAVIMCSPGCRKAIYDKARKSRCLGSPLRRLLFKAGLLPSP